MKFTKPTGSLSILPVILSIILSISFVSCTGSLPQMPDIKPGTCKLVALGIEKIKEKLSQGSKAAFVDYVEPAALKVDAQLNLDDLKEYWDQIPEEQKWEAALAMLQFIDSNYCNGVPIASTSIHDSLKGIMEDYISIKK